MFFSTYFSKQARKPSGLFGRFFMSQVFEKGNAELNTLVYDTMSVEPDDHVMEIGCGTGWLISRIAKKMNTGKIEGIDFSRAMVSAAKRKNRTWIRNGIVRLHQGDFDTAEFETGGFDKIFSVNTVYFWKHPKTVISRVCRLLKPEGRLFIGFHHKQDMEQKPLNRDVFQYYSPQDVTDLLSLEASVKDIEIVSRKGKQMPGYCAVAVTKR